MRRGSRVDRGRDFLPPARRINAALEQRLRARYDQAMGMTIWRIGVFTASALAVLATGPQRAAAHDSHDAREAPRAYAVAAAAGDSDTGTGVAVFADHSERSRQIGALAPGGGPVEVVETDRTRNWGRIVWGEGNGWVDLRALEPSEPPTLAGSAIPVGLLCLGTEPFWDVSVVSAAEMRVRRLDGVTAMARIGGATASRNGAGFPAMVWAEAGGLAARLLVRPGQCSDGASDRDYGWVADAVIVEDGRQSLFSGCCHLPYQH
jgi:uncharacterized membrane protein